jgi:protein-S-isoprenylcysteine O-methyltransferase Ste14
VAVLILKSAVELAVEAVRSLGEEEVDLSRYRFGVISKYNQFRQAQLRDWMLYLVEKQRAKTHTELIAQAHRALDFSRNPMLRELGLEKSSQASEMIKQSMANLFERGWLIGEERLSVTAAGRNHLHKQISEPFRPIDRHRSVIITARPIRETGITVMCAFILTVAWFILSLLPDSRLWASTEPFYRWGNYGFTYFTMLHVLAGFPLYLYSVLSIINITKENHAAQDRKTGTAVRLLKDGHYAKVRHPMYGMMITSWIGLGVALCSYWGLAVATIMTLLFAVNGVLEEKRDLIPRFGKKYLAYAKQVRARYLPIGLRAYVMCIVGLCLLGLFL